MSDHESLFQQELETVIKRLSDLVKKIPLNRALDQLRDLGLLEGIQDPNSPFLQRLVEQSEQKTAIAKYLTRRANGTGCPSLLSADGVQPHLFFESGSTIAYIIGEVAQKLSDPVDGISEPARKAEVLTNNLFCLTALADQVSHVAPIAGDLSTKYFGFFPSAEDDKHPALSSDPKASWLREIKGYSRLRDDIAECNEVIATCSNFSFLAGPLVGSRGNALAKHAIYSGRNRAAEFAVCVHFEKVIPVHPCSHPMRPPKSECYCVFNGIPDSTVAARTDIAAKCESQNWHQRWLKRCKTATKELFKAASEHRPILKPGWEMSDWLVEASGMRILVALPPDHVLGALQWLGHELRYVNKIVAPFYGIEYRLNESMDPMHWKVAEIRIVGP